MNRLMLPQLANDLLPLLQQDPWGPMGPGPDGTMKLPGFSLGQILFSVVVSIGIQVLFGLWAKSKAEDNDANPWGAFALGFFLAYLGVRMVPLLRPGAVFAKTRPPRPLPPRPAPGPYNYGQPVHMPPAAAPVATVPPTQGPLVAAPVAPSAATGPATTPPTGEADGYVTCPACQARAKAGRKLCMNCGNALPMIAR
ncbi:MAG: hypothetical protein IPP14_11335 [Planctomycetes bacterium]|nr:hypothetical protein [Planctomycetota bacterium]